MDWIGDNRFRRIITCSINTKEYGKAAEAFNEMPELARDSPASRFLMFKVALRTSDDDLGRLIPGVFFSLPSADHGNS